MLFAIYAPSASAGTIIKSPSYLGLNKGLVGCWTFDGAYTKAPDCSGNNNTGTLTNGPKQVEGRLGQALSFDGVDDYVDVTPSTELRDLPSTYNFTISIWAKCNGNANNKAALSWWGTDDLVLYPCDNVDTGNGVRVFWRDLGGNIIDENGIDRSGQWFHFVFVSRASNDHKVYINASKVLSSSATGSAGPFSDIYISDFESGDQDYPGSLDDVRIFNRALTASEIRRMYKIGLGSKQNEAAQAGEAGDQLDKGLVGHWTFDGKDISGTRAKDSSGQNNHGTLTNGPIQTIGKIGQALSFDGVNDYVSVPHSTSVNFGATTDSYSLSFWIKTTQAGSRYLFHKYTSGQSRYSFAFSISASNKINLAIWDGTNVPNVSSISSVNNNVWHHIVGIRNVATDKLDIYVDGVKEASATDTTTATTQNTGSAIYLGWDKIGGGGDTYFSGNFDDVRVYNRVLTAGEIARLYQMAQPKVNVTQNTLEKGIVGHWDFDGSNISGTRAKDSSGQNNHGTLTNGPVVTLGRIGQGMAFDGTNDYVNVGNSSSLDQNGHMSISAWIKPADTTTFGTILGQSNSGGTATDYVFELNRTAGKLSVHWGITVITANQSFTPNKWYHVVFTRTGSSGNWTVNLYISGVLDKSANNTIDPGGTNQQTSIGRPGAFDSRYFKGVLDDVRIYNRALSAGEVNKLWQMGR